jgi:hypothetical protein
MFGNQERQTMIDGVSCSVSTCAYHGTGNCCHANTINVGTEYAVDKSETFCTSYQHKPGK